MGADTPAQRAFSPIDGEALRRQLASLKSVPALPKLLQRIVEALEDPEVDFANVAELIEVDQAVGSQVLRLANSAYYSRSTVSSVSQALTMLGAVVTRSVVLSSTVLDVRTVPLSGFWEHSLGCAVAASALAKATGRANPEEAAAAGLLHDLGKVLLYQEAPDAFAQVLACAESEGRSFRDAERRIVGVDHGEIASWLVTKWRFPPSLAEPIMLHHAPARATRARDLTAIVHVANTLVRALGYGSGGDGRVPAIDPRVWKRLALTAPLLDRVLDGFETDLDRALNYALFE